MIRRVDVSRARKSLRGLPGHILDKLRAWVKSVKDRGIDQVRKLPGYHDEPLRGKRQGQRSIRLSRAYRAIYTEQKDDVGPFLAIEEVSKHEY